MSPLPRLLAVAASTLLAACAEVSAPSALRPTPAARPSVARAEAASSACQLKLVALSIETTAATGIAGAERSALLRTVGAASAAFDAGETGTASRTLGVVRTAVDSIAAAQGLEPASVAPLTAATRDAAACVAATGG